jgi:NAD(P)H-dependent flavin oxidoreductase YrpB (nitropropane dioxygenase family)
LWNNNYAAHHGLVANKEEKMAEESKITLEMAIEDGKRYRMIYDGNIDDGAVLLGQSIGVVNSIENVSNIVNSIVDGAEKRLKNAANLIK